MRLQGRENFHKSTTEHYEHEKYCESIIHDSVAKYYNEVKDVSTVFILCRVLIAS